jgi:hypothetical protein
MNIKDMLSDIQTDFNLSYKEARFHLKANLRKLYEAGKIDKEVWKAAKKQLTEELQ